MLKILHGFNGTLTKNFQMYKLDLEKAEEPEIIEKKKIAQSCPTLCNPMDCSLPGSSVHWIFQAIVLEWIAISFSRDLPNPGIEPWSLTL